MRSLVCVVVMVLTALLPLMGQDMMFRHDGQTGSDGKVLLSIPVKEGQQLLFRIASLDFPPRANLNINGMVVSFAAGEQAMAEQFVRVKRSGIALLSVENPNGTAAMSFQLRVLKYPENPPLVRNAVVRGSISSKDPVDVDHQRIDWYPLAVTKGQRLLIGLVSKAADARLQIELPDGRTLANDDYWDSDAGLIVDATESGTWWVGATLNASAATAPFSLPYSLFVREIPITSRVLPAGGLLSPVAFSVIAPGLPFIPETYTFTATKAAVYQFSLVGREGQNCLLRLRLSPTREIVAGSLRGPASPALINMYLRANQKVELRAEAIAGDIKASYTISANQTGTAVSLKDGDKLDQELKANVGAFYVYHGRAGEYVEFLMASDSLRTRLNASDEAGQLLTWANYYGSDFSHASLGGYYFEESGDLVLEAKGFDSGDEGKYQIQVHSALSGNLEVPHDWTQAAVLSSEKLLFSRLTSHDPVRDGHYANDYLLDLKASDLVSIAMKSHDFDCHLFILSQDGQQLFSNDDFEGSDSYLEFIAPRSGRYILRAASWIEEGTPFNATYTVMFHRMGTAVPLPLEVAERSGTFLTTTALNDDGRPYQEISQSFRAGQRVYFVVSSPDFNPRMQFLALDGTVLDENSGYGQGADARIDYTVRTAGGYRVRIIAGGDESAPALGAWSLSAWEIK